MFTNNLNIIIRSSFYFQYPVYLRVLLSIVVIKICRWMIVKYIPFGVCLGYEFKFESENGHVKTWTSNTLRSPPFFALGETNISVALCSHGAYLMMHFCVSNGNVIMLYLQWTFITWLYNTRTSPVVLYFGEVSFSIYLHMLSTRLSHLLADWTFPLICMGTYLFTNLFFYNFLTFH